jgi:hypothetical protein
LEPGGFIRFSSNALIMRPAGLPHPNPTRQRGTIP